MNTNTTVGIGSFLSAIWGAPIDKIFAEKSHMPSAVVVNSVGKMSVFDMKHRLNVEADPNLAKNKNNGIHVDEFLQLSIIRPPRIDNDKQIRNDCFIPNFSYRIRLTNVPMISATELVIKLS